MDKLALDNDELYLLNIINERDKGNGVSAPIIDRIFYDKRLANGCSLEELYSVQWIPKTKILEEFGLIKKQGLANKITDKGREFLKQHNENQA
jgi:repressor of nif and glnA expression